MVIVWSGKIVRTLPPRHTIGGNHRKNTLPLPTDHPPIRPFYPVVAHQPR
jgi:hypothetical protein